MKETDFLNPKNIFKNNKTLQQRTRQSKQAQTKKREDNSEKKILFGNRFEVTASRLLGKGSFGEIYIAQDQEDNYKYCALKIENRTKNFFLKIEKNVLELTNEVEGFPKLIMFNSQGESNFLAMELLGPNLSDLLDVCKGRFTLQTTLLIGIQMLMRVQTLHSKNYVHRDIKPENFLIGIGDNSSTVYIIDFGLSKKYKDAKMDHLPYQEHRPLTGTTRYASINNHLGIEQSRRDDLESIGYVLIYFLKKRLPWQGCQGSTKQAKYNHILEKKLLMPLDILCKDLPIEFSVYMNYVKALRFDERPDYEFLKGIFIDLLFSLYSEKFFYDWTLRYPDDAKNIKYQQMKTGDNIIITDETSKADKSHKKNNYSKKITEEQSIVIKDDDDNNSIKGSDSESDSENKKDTDKDKDKYKDKDNDEDNKSSQSSKTNPDEINNFDEDDFINIIQGVYKTNSNGEANKATVILLIGIFLQKHVRSYLTNRDKLKTMAKTYNRKRKSRNELRFHFYWTLDRGEHNNAMNLGREILQMDKELKELYQQYQFYKEHGFYPLKKV